MIIVLGKILIPVFGIILIGFLACRLKFMEQQDSVVLNRFVYFVAFPALLFVVMAKAPIEKIFYWSFLGAWGSGLLITFVITMILTSVIWRESLSKVSMAGLITTCSSTAFMGVPLVVVAYGDEAAIPAIMATTFLVIVVISFSLFLIEMDCDSSRNAMGIIRSIALSLIKNPLMIGAILGALTGFIIDLPEAVAGLFDLVGKSAIPVSLFTIGLFIAGQSLKQLKQGLAQVNVLVFIKLIIHPFVTWLMIEYVFDLEPLWAAVTVIISGLPPATTCFVIAQRYETYASETATMTVISTILSVITISILLVLMGVQ